MKRRSLLAGLASAALGGCISIGGRSKHEEPTALYTLHPREAAQARRATGKVAVVIDKPELPARLATDRIALVFDQGTRTDFYDGVKWSAPLDDLLQDFLIQTARRDLPGVIVGPPDQAASPRYRLEVKFTDFQPVYPGDPTAAPPRLDVGLTVTVVGLPSGGAGTQFSLRKSAPASANTVTAVTKGLEALLQSAADEAMQNAAPALRG